jgi:hypothetical protein
MYGGLVVVLQREFIYRMLVSVIDDLILSTDLMDHQKNSVLVEACIVRKFGTKGTLNDAICNCTDVHEFV